jgi:hypothetical protein
MSAHSSWHPHAMRHVPALSQHHAVRLASVAIISVILIAGCGTDVLLAPQGATISVAVNPNQVAAGGDTALITALVLESDGAPVEDETSVIFTVNRGGLCANGADPCADGSALSAFTATTKDGIASVRFVSGSVATTSLVTVRSGSATAATDTIAITNRAAPAGTKSVLVAKPDTVSVGRSADITAYLYGTDGAPVPDGTRLVFLSRDSLTVGRSLALTSAGFAETTVIGRSAGSWYLLVASGNYRDSVKVVVK